MAALKDPAALVWCSAETVSSKSTQKKTSFVPGIGCLKVDYGRISTKANLQRGWCFSLQASCPFGFENKESPKAIPNVATREPLLITPYAPAPSSLPSARNLGPGTYEYLPLKVPYKMTMGVEPMHPKDWIEIDVFYEEEMALRREILATRKEVAIASFPEATEANWEVLELLADHLPKQFPTLFTRDGAVIHNLLTGEMFDIFNRSLDPLEISARLVQEDLCLMMKKDGVLRFVSGAVLFPQRWQLLEKLGMDMSSIHMPVPLYETQIARSVDSFMERLKVGKPAWRSNWTIVDDPTLFQPLNEEDIYAAMEGKVKEYYDPVLHIGNAGTRLFTRCERETFVRLPRTQAILFTIRTYVKPLSVFESRPALAAEMVKALEALPKSISNYKTMAGYYHLALNYLQKCAGLTT
ncbi:unnamed protein product [Sphagnum troendelagicum]|uniref:Uncharacterized protein n=1 Tax=Sphagnum troendelagicum TaxID=128251 RepID=A0ABP0TTY2_9BRYO